MPNFVSNYARDFALDPAVARVIDVPIDGAQNWRFTLRNTGANPITAMTLEPFQLGVDEIGDDPVAATTGIPLAAGAAQPLVGTLEPITTLRVTLTSTLGTTVRIAGGGR